ncbi:acetyl-CoA C-acetyltransferase [Hoyosella sp. YIM 151337]|uniref:acetyl-CoA C-acetyltransferase n=1 Tax=Hoyosella sp. YIM 151337 TaxID=2992742 RepID=UPI00223651FA|nr:acetyl-CoA C-acetyltransferase [Hoyosella sp. YIM 151337]MCW4355693.1 acetyl-CoA C-acetyltransferase [Hoyosella sp. YIM 151337]
MREAVIVAAARSPIGRAHKGSLRECRADDLATAVTRAALGQVPELDPADIEDLLVGCAQPAGEQGYGLSRMIALGLDLDALPGTTVQRYCASSVQTTRMAAHAVLAGEGDVFISAGVEVVSGYTRGKADGMPDTGNPRYGDATKRTQAIAEGTLEWKDPRIDGELPNPYVAMGLTAEFVAAQRGVSRRSQDEFATLSQNRAEAAVTAGVFATEIVPITTPDGSVVYTDDSPRPGVTAESLAILKPVFHRDGTVTAGNCCPLNDGAAALVVMSDQKASDLGITPLARIVSTGVSALSPEIMGLGPVEASQQAMRRAGLSIGDIDLVEINEAFAAQVLPSCDDLGADLDKVNVYGGAIALGHPFGMTGARMTVTLLNALRRRDETLGLVTMCAAGGQGMAMIVERVS